VHSELARFLQDSLDDIVGIVLDREQEERLVEYLEQVIVAHEQFGEQVGTHLRSLVESLKARR
jgi:uncharacterized coiled-coil protein SlyX